MATDAGSSDTFTPWLQRPWAQFRNALAEQRLGHALLIAGEAGLGKRVLVTHMVARLLCRSPGDDDLACGRCRSCTWLAAGSHPDYTVVQPGEDRQFVKVDQIRTMNQRVLLTAQAGPLRVARIDPAEAMNPEAQNALLKTLEEPPAGAHLILVSDVPSRLLATVRSRCRSYTVAGPDIAGARDWLAQHGTVDVALALALAAGHPASAQAYAEPGRARLAAAVAEDLHALARGSASAIGVAGRWLEEPVRHVDDAIAWLRLWAWRSADVELAPAAPAPAPALILADRYRDALRLRERLRTPLKDSWLLHEWLRDWQSAG